MSSTTILLDNYKASCLLASDSALATSLGLTRQSVFQWRNGIAWPNDDHVITMATAIGEPAERWLASINMDRASPNAKPYWQKLLQAAAVVAIAVSIGRMDVHYAIPDPATRNLVTLYIM